MDFNFGKIFRRGPSPAEKVEEKEEEQDFVISLPEGIDTKVLYLKLQEYKERLKKIRMKVDPNKPPETQKSLLDTIYKITVLEKLLDQKKIDTRVVFGELKAKYGFVYLQYFNDACSVIEDYVKTGGKHNIGGGLRKLE